MSKAAEYKDFIQALRSSLDYWKTYALMQFTSSLARIMHREKVHGKRLASRLGVSPTQVSKVLRGQENITVDTMARFAFALDAVVHIHVAKRGVQVQWIELPNPETEAAQETRPAPPRAKATANSFASVSYIHDYLPGTSGGRIKGATLTQDPTLQEAPSELTALYG